MFPCMNAPKPLVEETLFVGRTHPKTLVVPISAFLLVVLLHGIAVKYVPADWGHEALTQWGPFTMHAVLLVANVWFAVWPVLQWRASNFEVTTRRVRMRWGVLYKNSREINLDRITQVNEERGIIDRIFGAGTIVIYDAANAAAVRFHDIPHFRSVRDLLDEARAGAHQVAFGPGSGNAP